MKNLVDALTTNLTNVLREAIQLDADRQALVIFDQEAPLARLLTEAYRNALPRGIFVHFAEHEPADILALIQERQPGDLVVLIQSVDFRLNEFRIRIEIFRLGLKTIEHSHLGRIDEAQFEAYVDELAYDPDYYRPLGHALKKKLDTSRRTVVECAGTQLVYDGPLEDTKLNIGDYTGMKNVGGTFPIGEVFTEAKDLTRVHGEAMVFGFAGEDHVMRTYPPFRINVTDGILTAPDGPPEFQHILDKIKQDEDVLVRELGFGLNPAVGKHRMVNDITAFERQKGVHLSLGAKHAMYPKPGLHRKHGRYHVDIFLDVERIRIDDQIVFENGDYSR